MKPLHTKLKSANHILFDRLLEVGEILDGSLHIIDTADDGEHYEQSFRVYVSSGYCFDSWKSDETDETDSVPRYDYGFYSEWPEFATIDAASALNLINEQLEHNGYGTNGKLIVK